MKVSFPGTDSSPKPFQYFQHVMCGVQYFFLNYSAPNVAVYCLCSRFKIQSSCCDVYLSVLVCEAAVFIFSDILDTEDYYFNFYLSF